MAASSRFVEISKEFLDNLPDNSIPEKTKKTSFVCLLFFLLLGKTTNFFDKFKTNQALLFSIRLFNKLSLFYYRMVCKPNKI